jgi:hypothetical protein
VNKELIAHLEECRNRLSDLRTRINPPTICCSLLRMEGDGGTCLYDDPFRPILSPRPYLPIITASNEENPFGIAFHAEPGTILDQLQDVVRTAEGITVEGLRLVTELPTPVRKRLVLPNTRSWWRCVFHLAWHFPRPFLRAARERLLVEGSHFSRIDDVLIQKVAVHSVPGTIWT